MIALLKKQMGKRQGHRNSSTLYVVTAAELFSVNPKCQAELYYTVEDTGPTIRIIKKPKNLPVPPALTE